MAREQDMKQARKKHGAAFKAKVARQRPKVTGQSPSWRVRTGFTRTLEDRSGCLTIGSTTLTLYDENERSLK
jgi:hypothetical protein